MRLAKSAKVLGALIVLSFTSTPALPGQAANKTVKATAAPPCPVARAAPPAGAVVTPRGCVLAAAGTQQSAISWGGGKPPATSSQGPGALLPALKPESR